MAGPLLMILFRQKYPKWWFDWNFALSKFTNRVAVYLFMLKDEYPSTDEEQAVDPELLYPERRARPEQMAPSDQVVLGHPPLHHPGGPVGLGGFR